MVFLCLQSGFYLKDQKNDDKGASPSKSSSSITQASKQSKRKANVEVIGTQEYVKKMK